MDRRKPCLAHKIRAVSAKQLIPCGVPKVGHIALTCALGGGFILVDQAAEDWSATCQRAAWFCGWVVWSWWGELSGSVWSAVVLVGNVAVQH